MQVSVFYILGAVLFFIILQGLSILIIRHFLAKYFQRETEKLKRLVNEARSEVEGIKGIKKEIEQIISLQNEAKNETCACSASENAPVSAEPMPFDFLKRCDPAQLLGFIQNEHPQTIALVLSYMEPPQAALMLQNLPAELQSDVFRRIACMDRANTEIVLAVGKVLEQHLTPTAIVNYTGGIESAVEILNLTNLASENQIIEKLEGDDPELAEEIKKRLFIFEDIVMLDDHAIQKVLREVDSQELCKALKGTKAEIHKKIFRNLSQRAGAMLREDMDYMGPLRLKDVEEAQEKIVSIIRCLEERGELIVARAGDDELVV